jgi:hypothetical protein
MAPLRTSRLPVSRAKFQVSLSSCETAERRLGQLTWNARENIDRVVARAGLTPVYLWTSSHSSRSAALCLDVTGRFFAVESQQPEPVSIAQGWAFALACREWAEHRDYGDLEAVCRWEEAILRQLQLAENKHPGL